VPLEKLFLRSSQILICFFCDGQEDPRARVTVSGGQVMHVLKCKPNTWLMAWQHQWQVAPWIIRELALGTVGQSQDCALGGDGATTCLLLLKVCLAGD